MYTYQVLFYPDKHNIYCLDYIRSSRLLLWQGFVARIEGFFFWGGGGGAKYFKYRTSIKIYKFVSFRGDGGGGRKNMVFSFNLH